MAEDATASISDVASAGGFTYTITLTDTGTTPIGTFWFSWVPGQGYLPDLPSFTSPPGWTAALTDGTPPANGYSIRFVANEGDALQPGDSFNGFVFTSETTPAELFGTSAIHSPTPVATSFIYAGAAFAPGDNGFMFDAACFAEGTNILTEDGEVPIERLTNGSRVVTMSGRVANVRWIGHRHVDCRRHPRPADVQPIRVSADAFGPGIPHRELLLSRDHAVWIDDMLIPVRYLANGTTIATAPMAGVTYWHVELDRHDVLLAEGLPAESYLDTGNRAAFANGGKVVMAQPDFASRVWEAMACAELVTYGPRLEAARSALMHRAEMGSSSDQAGMRSRYCLTKSQPTSAA